MIIPSADRLEKQIRSKYALVIAAAKRARQLKEGHPPLVRIPSANPLTTALEEIAGGMVIPLSPEVEEPAASFGELVPRVVEKEAFDLAAALSAVAAEEAAAVEVEAEAEEAEAEEVEAEAEGETEEAKEEEDLEDYEETVEEEESDNLPGLDDE
ncbi:MAG: DNA-directed RNA polymerase subunit omega [Armatimonadetes bacterium]|nr:DNA-directed RNA polymerase subunit omega [Armatimonadota bacterium]